MGEMKLEAYNSVNDINTDIKKCWERRDIQTQVKQKNDQHLPYPPTS